ncbi:MAG: flagellar hook-basal body complex protein FliE [Rhodothalassiaceae bacterium]
MDAKSLDAANAYRAALGGANGPGLDRGDRVGRAATGGTGSTFGGLVETLVNEAQSAVAASEIESAKAVAGQAELVDVVTAVSNAEMVLETVTTVRDRVISAYQEIMRMPI